MVTHHKEDWEKLACPYRLNNPNGERTCLTTECAAFIELGTDFHPNKQEWVSTYSCILLRK